MLNEYRPMAALLALWPTQDFEIPVDGNAFSQRLRETMPHYKAARVLQGEVTKAPRDMARVQLQSEGNQWALDLAPARVALRRNLREPMPMPELFTGLRDESLRLNTWLAENANFRVYRIGCLVQFFCPTRSSSNAKIGQYFLQPRALQGENPQEVNVNVLNRLTLGEWMVNRWLRVRPLRNQEQMDFAAQIEIDINTLPEDTSAKTGRDIEQFLTDVQKHMEEDVPLLKDGDFLA